MHLVGFIWKIFYRNARSTKHEKKVSQIHRIVLRGVFYPSKRRKVKRGLSNFLLLDTAHFWLGKQKRKQRDKIVSRKLLPNRRFQCRRLVWWHREIQKLPNFYPYASKIAVWLPKSIQNALKNSKNINRNALRLWYLIKKKHFNRRWNISRGTSN